MSHMDSTVVIGSRARGGGGGGGGPRDVVARTRAEQNAAARSGNLTASKKMGSINATNQNHQKAYKIENTDRFVMDEKSDNKVELEKNLTRLINALGLSQSKLAQDASALVGRLWVKTGSGLEHDYRAIRSIEFKYCWTLNGPWGPRKISKKQKDNEAQILEYHEKLKAVKVDGASKTEAKPTGAPKLKMVKPAGAPVLKIVKPAGDGSK
ncbi:hypothetical protein GGTG_00774 [Gaeumannomyces tritici R3-111a-1]|uniref:Multiprotein bridging factor 1 N-terminal domain-containing protein n=1 Tax=Gaeumannomyces tritici (strain R3-111a-1) TaxID=644352 RepID=J3NHN7_GAET3|nr:hypothetical protein GGTG_00774 [Gaeumannomyces tritici R3-111a-1]EJT80780.1 hypothetical protein GGTG_00774 [Gaeumannomyces tritici R3-111a-1]